MPFSPENRRELEQSGFTRVQGVIPEALIEPLLARLPSACRVDLRDPSTGYTYKGIIPVHHLQEQWNRSSGGR